MNVLRIVLTVAAGLGVAGCATTSDLSVRTQQGADVDMASFETYDWHASLEGARRPAVTDRLIRETIEQVLQDKGMRPDAENPDVWIGFTAAVERDLETGVINQQYGYAPGFGAPLQSGPGYRRYIPGWAPGTESMRVYEKGSLILDIVDADSEKPVWRASAQAEIDRDRPDEVREQRLRDAVTQMLAGFKE